MCFPYRHRSALCLGPALLLWKYLLGCGQVGSQVPGEGRGGKALFGIGEGP